MGELPGRKKSKKSMPPEEKQEKRGSWHLPVDGAVLRCFFSVSPSLFSSHLPLSSLKSADEKKGEKMGEIREPLAGAAYEVVTA